MHVVGPCFGGAATGFFSHPSVSANVGGSLPSYKTKAMPTTDSRIVPDACGQHASRLCQILLDGDNTSSILRYKSAKLQQYARAPIPRLAFFLSSTFTAPAKTSTGQRRSLARIADRSPRRQSKKSRRVRALQHHPSA